MNKVSFGTIGFLTVFLAGSAPAVAQDGLEWGDNGLVYEGDNVSFNLGGRLHLDAAHIDDGALSTDDEEIRRARLEMSLRLYEKLRLRVDREFAQGGGWRNVWMRYDVNDDFYVKGGNFIAPFSMEDVGSSNETMFMERSLAQALAPGFGVGVGASYEGKRFSVTGGYFGDAIDTEDNIQASKGKGVAVRATWSPIEHRDNVLHLGVGFDHRNLDTGDTRRISTGPEASLGPTLVSTGTISDPDTTTSYNLETAYSSGPFLAQAQFMSTELDRTSGQSLTFDGYYLQAGWIITGERYRYGDAAGVFRGPRPKGKWGAFEIAARVSNLDLSEAGAAGSGEANDATLGFNWYIGRNVRLMANYVHAELDAVDPLLDRNADIAQARIQFDF